MLAQPLHELEINLLRLQATIYEDKQVSHLLAAQHIALNHAPELLTGLLAALGIAVAREIDDIPLAVDEEVIDEQRLARGGAGLGQGFTPREHIDERRLAHITASDEGILGQRRVRALAIITVADLILC